jgi:prephenate dehydrogenase
MIAARQLPDHLTFVGGHPLGGAPLGGIEHARPDLFEGRPWLFTPEGDDSPEAVARLFAFVRTFGAEPHAIQPAEHDALLAFVSHLPQLATSALMHVVGANAGDRGLALTGRGLFDATRLASSPAGIWRDICHSNADSIGAALDAFIGELQQLRADLDSGAEIDKVFDSAGEWRRRLAELRAAKKVD